MSNKLNNIRFKVENGRYADDNALVKDIMFVCKVSRTRAYDIGGELTGRALNVRQIVQTCYQK